MKDAASEVGFCFKETHVIGWKGRDVYLDMHAMEHKTHLFQLTVYMNVWHWLGVSHLDFKGLTVQKLFSNYSKVIHNYVLIHSNLTSVFCI